MVASGLQALAIKEDARSGETPCDLLRISEQEIDEVVAEPLLRNAVEFSVLVVDTPAGPRSSMPLEIEHVDVREDFVDAHLERERFFGKLMVSSLPAVPFA